MSCLNQSVSRELEMPSKAVVLWSVLLSILQCCSASFITAQLPSLLLSFLHYCLLQVLVEKAVYPAPC